MHRMISIERFCQIFFLVLTTVLISSAPVFSGMTLADNPSGTSSMRLAEPDRFVVVMNNEAVLDRWTGLVWERDTDLGKYTWQDAITHCYNTDIGGRGGWRLPTVAELTTLVDKSQTNPSLTVGHPFTNTQTSAAAAYWSFSTEAATANCAWLVFFYYGHVGYGNKSLSYYVRAVRSGQ